MKVLGAIAGVIVVILVGTFIYLSVADVSVEQTSVTKNIPIETK